VLAKRASNLDLTLSQLSALRSRISELEAQLESSRRECCKSQELNAKLQFDLHEVSNHFTVMSEGQLSLLPSVGW